MKWLLWKVSDLAESIGVSWWGDDLNLPDLFCVDSREVCPGSAFVAIRGNNQDGHDYIQDAFKRGAVLVIAEKDRFSKNNLKEGQALIEVENTTTDLARMAQAYLSVCSPDEVVAITGSVGKTTTRELLKKCFEGAPLVYGAEKSFNTLIGCSLTILGMPAGTSVLILEMGTNKPGEIEEMVRYFPPTRAIITEATSAHLEGLGSIDGVISAKMEIAKTPALKTLIYNADNDKLAHAVSLFSGKYRKIGVGLQRGEVRVLETTFDLVENLPRLKTTISTIDGHVSDIYSGLWGSHNSLLIAFAFAVYLEMGYPREEAIKNLETMSSLPGRGCVFATHRGALIIDDAYNANPLSMKASLSTFASLAVVGRKIAVLGSMKELGLDEDQLHEEVLRETSFLDALFLLGEEWRWGCEKLPEILRNKIVLLSAIQPFAKELAQMIGKGDAVLLKGSHIHNLEKVVLILMEETES